MKKEQENYEIGQWIGSTEGLGQVLFIREDYVEKYSSEYFEGKKVGEDLGDILVYKQLCDFTGKLRKKDLINWAPARYCEPISDQYRKMVEAIKSNSPEEYRRYLVYDSRLVTTVTTEISFRVPPDAISSVEKVINEINKTIKKPFTLKEFLATASEMELPLDFSQVKKYVPGSGQNFTVNLSCPLYKTINKQRISARVKVVVASVMQPTVTYHCPPNAS